MPKVVKKAPRKKTKAKKGKKGSIGIYLLIGIVCAGLVYWLSTTPKSLSEHDGTEYAEQDQDKAQETAPKQKQKTKNKSTAKSTTPQNSDKSHSATSLQEAPVQESIANLDDAIKVAIQKLGIPEASYRRKERDKQITYNIPLNRRKLDLTFANIIIKGEVEKLKGRMLSGIEKENKQTLTFSQDQNPKKYVVELYYDSKAYANKTPDKVMAIVIDDFGYIDGKLLDGFMKVDKAVNFAIFPNEKNSIQTMQMAHNMGRETLIHVPMEPLNYPNVNPGKDAILVTMKEHEIDNRMEKFIEDMNLCKGINNHMGSLATTDEGIMQAVMISLKKHKLYFLDSKTSNVSVAYNVAQKSHITAFRNDIFLDTPNLKPATMDDKLQQCIDMASRRTQIVAIMHCHSAEHLAYLQRFIERAKAAGFKLVPLSALGNYNVPSIN